MAACAIGKKGDTVTLVTLFLYRPLYYTPLALALHGKMRHRRHHVTILGIGVAAITCYIGSP
jgi:hypothetical protein